MEEQFIPYEQALELRELGFDEECFGGWGNLKEWYYHPDSDILLDAPLWQQAFDWFESERGLYSHRDNLILSYGITSTNRSVGIKIERFVNADDEFKNRGEVKLANLKKLIELNKISS